MCLLAICMSSLPIKAHLVKAMVFPVIMYGCESWTIRNLSTKNLMVLNCGVGEDSCPLDSKEIKPVNPKGNQSWIFIGMTELNWTERSKYFSTYFILGSQCFLDTSSVQFSSFQSLSHVQLFPTPWTASSQASLSFINSQSLLKLMSIELVMPSNLLILYHPLLLLPSIFPSIRVFSSESVLCIGWPQYWSFSFSISPSSEYSGLISFRIDWFYFLAVQGTRVFSNTTVQKHQFFGIQLSL